MLLCLAAFGLGQALLPFGVRCTGSSGESRIELACLKDSLGYCQSACSRDSHDDPQDHDRSEPADTHSPCEDQPLGSSVPMATKLAQSSLSLDTILTVVAVVLIVDSWAQLPIESKWVGIAGLVPQRPPPNTAHLRTVILLV